MVRFGILYETQTNNKLGTSSKEKENKCAHTQGNASALTWHVQWRTSLRVPSCYSQHVCPLSWTNVHSLFYTSCTLLFEMQVCSFCGQLSTSYSVTFLTPLHKPIQNAINHSLWTPKQQFRQVNLEFLHFHHKAVQNPNREELMALKKSKTTTNAFLVICTTK